MTLELTIKEICLLKRVIIDAAYKRGLQDRRDGTKYWTEEIEILKGIKTKIDNEVSIADTQDKRIIKIQTNSVYGILKGKTNGKQK